MSNFIFISPNFPTNYWQFCRELKNNGLNVLGIGDQPYEELKPELKASLNEYYKVNSLENYDEVYRAVAFFTFKYGRIDWLESNNEYWLERDAALRTDFHITSGFQTEDMPRIKYKSKMKEYYQKAGIATARYHMVDDFEGCKKFIDEVGYPVVVKPDNGVGASDTHKLSDDEELRAFLTYKSAHHADVSYIMEEFVHAEVNSYDAIIDGSGNPIFEAGNVSPMSIMDIVNNDDNSIYYIIKDLPEDTRAAGRAVVKSFGVKSRFVHFEFFRMTADQASMGQKGQIVALEVNMRPCGGFTPDMINFARSTNVYKIWADMIAFGGTDMPVGEHYYCPFVGRRDGKNFVYSHEQIMQKYQKNIKMVDRIPDALSGAMGNQMYVATFSTREEMEQFYSDVLAVTMPCFGTTRRTRGNAEILCEELHVSFSEIDIANTVHSHFADIGQDESVLDVTFENGQARVRTLELMDTILGDNFDPEIMRAALKAMFNGTFFYGHEKADGTLDEDSGGILVKVNVKTGETKLLMSESTTGQGPLFRNAIRFNDKLYFCGSVRAKGQRSGLPSIYCVDPETDEINCVYTGITPAEAGAAYKEGISTGIRGMAVFDGEFIASCVGVDGPYILKSSDPSAGQSSFKKIATKSDLFNYPAYHYTDSIYGGSIWEMVEFNGSLYVALCTGTQDNKPDEHTMQSFAIVRGDENSDGSWTWTPVVGDKSDGARYTFGIDPERTRAGACNMLVYNNHLYIGEYEDIEIALEDVVFNKNVEFLAKNLEQSVSLYRMDKNENMELSRRCNRNVP